VCGVPSECAKEYGDVGDFASGDCGLPDVHKPGPGIANAQCSECHTYHDWSKRKEVKPTFVMPGLKTGGN
jgi:hypothetical protein